MTENWGERRTIVARSSSRIQPDDYNTPEGQRRRKLEAQLREEELKAAIAKAKGSGTSSGSSSNSTSGANTQDKEREFQLLRDREGRAAQQAITDKERDFQLFRDREARAAQKEMGEERLKADRVLAADRAAEIIAQRREASSRSRQVMQALSRSR